MVLLTPWAALNGAKCSEYYKTHYIASVVFENNEMIVKDGKNALAIAKVKTNECYVRDIENNSEVKLVLRNKEWVVAPPCSAVLS